MSTKRTKSKPAKKKVMRAVEVNLLADYIQLTWDAQAARKALIERLEEVFTGKDDPTSKQCVLLACLFAHPGMSQTELVEITGIDRSTLAEMIKRLSAGANAKRWVTQVDDEKDKRKSIVNLTTAGEKMAQRVVDTLGHFKPKLVQGE
jgi:DNA-binding MarR family transcriptional regulator